MIPFAVSFGFRVMDALRGVQLLGLASVARAEFERFSRVE